MVVTKNIPDKKHIHTAVFKGVQSDAGSYKAVATDLKSIPPVSVIALADTPVKARGEAIDKLNVD